MKLYPARYTQMLREHRDQESKWLALFVAIFIVGGCMLVAVLMGAK